MLAHVGGEHSESVRISVVIPTYNAARLLPLQLESLNHQTTSEPFEVIVADNGSTDGLVELLDQWRGRVSYRLRHVDASRRQGVSHARNAGVAASDADFVLICDADDAVCPTWVDGHLRALEAADLSGGPLEVERLNPGPQRYWRTFPLIDDDWQLPLERDFLPWITGANFGARRSAVVASGGWDEGLDGRGGDDADFSWRAQLRGFRAAAAPTAVVSYRLREGLLPTARQMYSYTVCFTELWERFADHGLRPATFRNAAAGFLHMLLRRAHHLARGDQARGQWVVNVALSYGILVAVMRYNLRGRRRTSIDVIEGLEPH